MKKKNFLKKGGVLTSFFLFLFLFLFLPSLSLQDGTIKANFDFLPLKWENFPQFLLVQENSLLPLSPLLSSFSSSQMALVTAYSSTFWETDEDPHITAAGTLAREGIVANNKYPFGTKVKFPKLFGEKIFIVEDRMHWTKGENHFDIWFPSFKEAQEFGIKWTQVEILE